MCKVINNACTICNILEFVQGPMGPPGRQGQKGEPGAPGLTGITFERGNTISGPPGEILRQRFAFQQSSITMRCSLQDLRVYPETQDHPARKERPEYQAFRGRRFPDRRVGKDRKDRKERKGHRARKESRARGVQTDLPDSPEDPATTDWTDRPDLKEIKEKWVCPACRGREDYRESREHQVWLDLQVYRVLPDRRDHRDLQACRVLRDQRERFQPDTEPSPSSTQRVEHRELPDRGVLPACPEW